MELEGYEVSGKEHFVCKVKKNLYGLKQSSKFWYRKFDAFMKVLQRYTRNNEDACLYTKTYSNESSIMLILYVDDMLIVGKVVEYSIAYICKTEQM
jgi:hypothetical protein